MKLLYEETIIDHGGKKMKESIRKKCQTIHLCFKTLFSFVVFFLVIVVGF